MIKNKTVIVVLPAYNAEKTLTKTYNEIPFDVVDDVILVDDASKDETIKTAQMLGIKHIIRHSRNLGYGGNQKSCYKKALSLKADIIIMLHPDHQYPAHLIPQMADIIANEKASAVIASRMMDNSALSCGMPLYKYISNRVLTFFQNTLLSQKLSEYHTGYRAYSREILETIPYEQCSNNFIFDNQLLSQIIFAKFAIHEVSCRAHYSKETSSINFFDSLIYGIGVIYTTIDHILNKSGILKSARYSLKTNSRNQT